MYNEIGDNMKKVFIGCSSVDEIDKIYFEKTREVCEKLVEKEYDLVFGAAKTGLMGESYRTFKKAGRRVIGVVPEIFEKDFEELDCDEEFVTRTINEREEKLINLSDLIVILPGGTGTLDELVKILELKHWDFISHKVIIFDINNFYKPMIEQIEKVEELGFTKNVTNFYKYVNTIEDLEKEL